MNDEDITTEIDASELEDLLDEAGGGENTEETTTTDVKRPEEDVKKEPSEQVVDFGSSVEGDDKNFEKVVPSVEEKVDLEVGEGSNRIVLDNIFDEESLDNRNEEEPLLELEPTSDEKADLEPIRGRILEEEPEGMDEDTIKRFESNNSISSYSSNVLTKTGLVSPVCSIQDALNVFKQFERAKRELLTDADILWIGSDGRPTINGQGTPYIRKSGWRKFRLFFGLNLEVLEVVKLRGEDDGYIYRAKVKIIHPCGSFVITYGVASSKDPFFTKGGNVLPKENDIIHKSITVAFNRGSNDILGGGEISAEEIESSDF